MSDNDPQDVPDLENDPQDDPQDALDLNQEEAEALAFEEQRIEESNALLRAELEAADASNVTLRQGQDSQIEALRAQLESAKKQLQEVGIEVTTKEKLPEDLLVKPSSTRSHNDSVSQARRKSMGKSNVSS